MPRPILRPLARLYGLGQKLDRARKRARIYRSALPVISVGNISVGGAGKTPLVELLVEQIQQEWPVLILSRGYGRRRPAPWLWRSGEPFPDPRTIGDEPAALARRVRHGAIGVASDRASYLRAIEPQFAGSVVILDDGFQHYALDRDLDIVIVDDRTVEQPELLPAGDLREPPVALRRAGLILASSDGAAAFAGRWAGEAVPVLRFQRVPSRPYLHDDRSVLYEGGRVVAVSGIARPERFSASLRELRVDVASSMPFPDHRRYGPIDIRSILSAMARAGAERIVTTTKDAVKLEAFEELRGKILVVDIRLRIEDEERFRTMVREAIVTKFGSHEISNRR